MKNQSYVEKYSGLTLATYPDLGNLFADAATRDAIKAFLAVERKTPLIGVGPIGAARDNPQQLNQLIHS